MAKNVPKSGKQSRSKTTVKGKRYHCAKCRKRSPKPVKTPAPWYCPECLKKNDAANAEAATDLQLLPASRWRTNGSQVPLSWPSVHPGGSLPRTMRPNRGTLRTGPVRKGFVRRACRRFRWASNRTSSARRACSSSNRRSRCWKGLSPIIRPCPAIGICWPAAAARYRSCRPIRLLRRAVRRPARRRNCSNNLRKALETQTMLAGRFPDNRPACAGGSASPWRQRTQPLPRCEADRVLPGPRSPYWEWQRLRAKEP